MSEVISTSGKKKSFQIGTAFWIATITSAGRERECKKGQALAGACPFHSRHR
ncbi:hypothetical protein P9273_14035 [Mesorhizobium sp. WSM4935]|uniref:hypothetical protein n=1 Tax=Mesorhizobium sp. WSM4935 TaxID=3038547 RepID=UPI002414F0F7|nr:hypothetical protein [Mesorhizobium sp. WSM4935]MDG4876220.1 hypothetical protein [Mesorhizobium sp. WSM4935]